MSDTQMQDIRLYLAKVPGRLESLLDTGQKKVQFAAVVKEAQKPGKRFDAWIKKEAFTSSLKDGETIEKAWKKKMPLWLQWAEQYYEIRPIKSLVTIERPKKKEHVLAAHYTIAGLVEKLRDLEQRRELFEKELAYNENNVVGSVGFIEEDYPADVIIKIDDAFGLIRTDLEQHERNEGEATRINVPKVGPTAKKKNQPKKPKAKTKKKKAKGKSAFTEPMSMPLFPKQWAEVFGVCRGTIRQWERDGTYPFDPVTPRKWRLPISSLPAEYLQKYRHISPPNKT